MWFVAALLVFSVDYAVVRRLHPMPHAHRRSQRMTVAIAMGTIAVTSLAVWQLWPPTAEAFLNLKFAEWPQGAVLFALGVTAAEAGWTEKPPTLSRIRWLGWGALAGVVAFAAVLALGLAAGVDDLGPGYSWPIVAAAFLDGFVSVAWTIWFVLWAPIDLGVWPNPACFAVGFGLTRLPWLSIVF